MATATSCTKTTWLDFDRKLTNESLSIIGINVRSLSSRYHELVAHLNIIRNKPTMIVLTETWLSENSDIAFDIEGYKSLSIYRDGKGGGIKIYFLDCIKATVIDELSGCSPNV